MFSSIDYQVQEITYIGDQTPPFVKIIPYSGSLPEIIVIIDNNIVSFEGFMENNGDVDISMHIENTGDPREADWDNPWRNISIEGNNNTLLEKIRNRREIADRLASMKSGKITVKNTDNKMIRIEIKTEETPENVNLAYSLLKDIQWFLEITLY
jgi:hypothetical protein